MAVHDRAEWPGFTAWSVKQGVPHTRPPVAILENMLTCQFHLDDTDESNGGLRVIPGSHRSGYVEGEGVRAWLADHDEVAPRVPRGGAMVMRPLLLHASGKSQLARHRRILHVEFSAVDLPMPLRWHEAFEVK